MKRKCCLTPANPSGVNMANAGFQDLGNHIANAAADTRGTAVIKVKNKIQKSCYCFGLGKEVCFIKAWTANDITNFFFSTTHTFVAFFFLTIRIYLSERRIKLFPWLYLHFGYFFTKCFAVKTFFLFFAFIQKHIFTIFNYYLLPAVSFCIYCFSAFCNWEAKSNDSAPSFITNSTFDLSASTDLSQRIMQVRWMKTGWLFPLPFSFVYQSFPSPSLSLTPDGIYFVLYVNVNRRIWL